MKFLNPEYCKYGAEISTTVKYGTEISTTVKYGT